MGFSPELIATTRDVAIRQFAYNDFLRYAQEHKTLHLQQPARPPIRG